MKRQIRFFCLCSMTVMLALGTTVLGQAQHEPTLDPQKISQASGAEAKTKDGVVRIEWPRKEVSVKVDGMSSFRTRSPRPWTPRSSTAWK